MQCSAKDAQIQTQQRSLAAVEQDLDSLKKQLSAATDKAEARAKGTVEELQKQLTELQQLLSHETARATSVELEAEAARCAMRAIQDELEVANAAAHNEEADTFNIADNKEADTFNIAEKDAPASEHEPVDFDDWNIRSAGDTCGGMVRLRDLILDSRRAPTGSLLETDEIRAVLQIARQICLDKSLLDSSCVGASSAQCLPLPE